MSKIKLLWIGDSPDSTTGFGRVAQGVLENLYGKYDISVLGINQQVGDPHRYEGMFRIYPASAKGNVYGFNRVEEVIGKEHPDIIAINNDLWIVSEYAKAIPKGNRVFTYSPVDALPVSHFWLDELIGRNVRVGSYTEFARNGIHAARPNIAVDIIGHGVDTDEFYPISDAREFISNVEQDVFIVQNVNRNQPRKRLDLFLKAVQIWLDRKSPQDRKNIACYYHGKIKDVGWNVIDLSKRWGIDDRFLVSDQAQMSTPAKGVPLSALCKIYNIADVHVMTSMGEGFGLSPFESAACGVAQVVPDHSACAELWKGHAELIQIERREVFTGGINTEGGVISVEHLAAIFDDLYMHRDKVKALGQDAYNYVHQRKFTWEDVANKFDSIFTDMLSSEKWMTPEAKEEASEEE